MKDKIRILHVVLNLHYGGVETFAMNLLRSIDRSRYSFDFAVFSGPRGMNETEAQDLGAKIFRYRRPRNALGFIVDIEQTLRTGGRYDILHSHLGLPSALALLAAHKHSIPGRIAHAHSAISPKSWSTRLAARPLLASISRTATRKLAVSPNAATSYYGEFWADDPLVELLPCGTSIPPAPVESQAELRRSLGLPLDAPILVTVGRMVPVKNQEVLLSVLRHLQASQPTFLLIVGNGPLKQYLTQKARDQGLANRVLMPGHQNGMNVMRYLHSSDIFLLPSHSEGLPMSAIEAQAAGLPCILSTGVPEEASVLPELTRFVPLSDGASVWAQEVRAVLLRGKTDLARAQTTVLDSEFSISSADRRLEQIYEAQARC